MKPKCNTRKGQGLVEYALILGLMAIVCMATLMAFGTTNGGYMGSNFNTIQTALSGS